MPQSYSGDLRERAIGTVEAAASRWEAVELFEISISSTIIWVLSRENAATTSDMPDMCQFDRNPLSQIW